MVVALVACTTPSDDPAPRDEPSAEAAAPGTEVAPTPAAEPSADLVTAVTSAGIRIVAADGSTAYGAVAPVSGIEVTEEQLAGLVAEAESRSGSLGSTLDGVIATDVPLSAFLVGYARGADTPAAHLAASALEGQDLTHPDRVVFPALVPMLFAADLAHAAGDPDAVALAPSAYSTEGLCSSVSASITRGINAVFDALHLNYANMPKTGIALLDGIVQGMADLVVNGVNIVVEAGRTLVLGLKKYLIDQVLSVVAKVAAIASMVAMFSSYVHKVNLKIDFGAEEVWKGVEPTGTPVTATLTASTDYGFGPVDWPREFEDCAKEAGVQLTPLKPLGEHVRWELEGGPDLLRSSSPGDETLGDGGPGIATATWELITGTEAPGLTGEGVEEKATVTASVERTKVKGLIQTLVAMAGHWLAGPLPSFIRAPLEAAVTDGVNSLLKDFVKLMDLETSRGLIVKYHEPDKPKPKKHQEVWDGSWVSHVFGGSGTVTMSVTRSQASMTGSLQVSGAECIQSGQLEAQVEGDQVQFGLISGGVEQISFSGVIEGRRVVGTWALGAVCGNDAGTWQADISRTGRG